MDLMDLLQNIPAIQKTLLLPSREHCLRLANRFCPSDSTHILELVQLRQNLPIRVISIFMSHPVSLLFLPDASLFLDSYPLVN